MAHDVFISYSSKDKPAADACCAMLESKGIRCWMAPRDIMPGADWGESIIDAVHESAAFVLVFSANANGSPQIKREVERAINKGIPVIPLRIENVMPVKSLEYFLSTPHWLDAFSPPLGEHLSYLADVIRSVLDKEKSPPPRPVPGPAPQPAPAPIFVPPSKGGLDKRLLLGGAALLVLAGVGWHFFGTGGQSFVGKWTATQISVSPGTASPFGAYSISVFFKAALAGNKFFATSQMNDVGNYQYSFGGDDTGTVTPAGAGRLNFTSDLTHQSTLFGYYLLNPTQAEAAVGALGGKQGEQAITLQNFGGMQSVLVGTSYGANLAGHWYTDTPANGPIDAIKTSLDITADGHYHYHFEFAENGLFQAANGTWSRTRPNAPTVSGTYKFDGPDKVETASDGGTTIWARTQ